MNIYFGPKDQELVKRIEQEAKQRKRAVCYIIKEKLRKAYGLNGEKGGD